MLSWFQVLVCYLCLMYVVTSSLQIQNLFSLLYYSHKLWMSVFVFSTNWHDFKSTYYYCIKTAKETFAQQSSCPVYIKSPSINNTYKLYKWVVLMTVYERWSFMNDDTSKFPDTTYNGRTKTCILEHKSQFKNSYRAEATKCYIVHQSTKTEYHFWEKGLLLNLWYFL